MAAVLAVCCVCFGPCRLLCWGGGYPAGVSISSSSTHADAETPTQTDTHTHGHAHTVYVRDTGGGGRLADRTEEVGVVHLQNTGGGVCK